MSESFRKKFIILLVTIGIVVLLDAKLSTHQKSRWAEGQCRSTMTNIGNSLKHHFANVGQYPSADSEYFLKVLSSSTSATNSSTLFYLKPWNTRTNALDGLPDCWGMALRMEMVGETNFIIRSAGPNRKFGDKDDIVFSSAANNFVKP